MSISHEEIYKACLPVLENVGYHDTSERHERRFITAYQTYECLRKVNFDFCQVLIEACGGEFLGKNAGSNIGPAQKIAQSLGRNTNIETQYLDTISMAIADNTPAGDDCGIFRLRPEVKVLKI
jgi:hypothetical protein